MRPFTFKKLGSFDGDDPDKLDRQLAQLEENVDKGFDGVVATFSPRLVPTSKKTSAYSAALDELVVCAGTFTVVLPVAAPANAGRAVGVLVQSGTITTRAASGLVQGAATDSVATVGVSLYISDGVGWWRVRG